MSVVAVRLHFPLPCVRLHGTGFVRHGVPSVKGDFRHLSAEELMEFREIFSLVDRVSS